jgi:DNA-binding FadR family transcriptional regulator
VFDRVRRRGLPAVFPAWIRRLLMGSPSTLSRLLHALVAQYYVRSAAASNHEKMLRAVRSSRKLVRLIDAGDAEAAEEHWRKQLAFTIEGWHRDHRVDLFEP